MSANRLKITARLQPLLGSTFQPTGFPDIGAATFDAFVEGERVPSLLVESVQSMANRLEATAWDPATQTPVPEVAGLASVRVERDGQFVTSSRLEAHRLASAWIRDSTLDDRKFEEVIGDRLELDQDVPLDYPRMARAVAQLDPFCLVHGVFFSQKGWLGQPKFPRAVSAVIEARNVSRAVSGGRKADHVRHSLDRDQEGGGTSEGYGSVPFHRVEFTAESITASFVLDRELLRSYGLGEVATGVLEAVAQWEVRLLLDGGLRLRTACDLEVIDVDGDDLPSEESLASTIASGVTDEVFAPGETLVLAAPPKRAKKAKSTT